MARSARAVAEPADAAGREARSAIGRHAYAVRFGAGRSGTADIDVAHSVDSGRVWSRPASLDASASLLSVPDAPRVTADPFRPAVAYLVWILKSTLDSGPFGTVWQLRFSRTEDGGISWSTPRTIYSNNRADSPPQFPRVLVGPGRVVCSWVNQPVRSPALPEQMQVMNSVDAGVTWDTPQVAARWSPTAITDPENGALVDVPAAGITIERSGALDVAYRDVDSRGRWSLRVTRSSEAGASWTTAPALLTADAPILHPEIAASGRGSLAVTWSDLRSDRRGDASLTARPYIATSISRGRPWITRPTAAAFDLRPLKAAGSGVEYPGGYQGLAGTRNGFVFALSVGKPVSAPGSSAILAGRVIRRR